MADIADIANDRMLIELDRQLAARELARQCPVAEECEECGITIPFERVQALAKLPCLRCVDCQAYLESKGGARVTVRGVDVPVNSKAYIADGVITGAAPDLLHFDVDV